jgi:two-component system, OmpR family, sensor histidine kinase CiaH
LFKQKKIKSVFLIYWVLLAYIIAALVWWYIALSRQNDQMIELKIADLKKDDIHYIKDYESIQQEKKRKMAQYLGEGAIFFLLISAGAIFVYRSVNRQLKTSLQQQNFMIAVTHELKTPIAITKLNLETLQKRKLEEVQQQKLLQNTLQEANRMNALCNNMLLSSQIEAGGYRATNEEINMGSLVQNGINDFKTRFPQREIFAKITEEASFIIADQLLISMAVNNLLDNAQKYSPKENKIQVELENNNGTIELRVMDEGPGIDESEKKKIFEKFYRVGNEATKHAKGTGLGLYLTKKIISAHKGKIFVLNNEPKGSIFVIQLQQAV